jgi:hypothetical protein
MFSPLHLAAHCSGCRFTTHENLQSNIFTVPETKQVNATSIPVDRMNVTMPVVCEQRGTPRMGSDDSDSSISTDEQMHGRPNGSSRDYDVQRSV